MLGVWDFAILKCLRRITLALMNCLQMWPKPCLKNLLTSAGQTCHSTKKRPLSRRAHAALAELTKSAREIFLVRKRNVKFNE